MHNKAEKPGFRENLSWLWQGYKLAGRMTPAYLPCMLSVAFITAAQPLMVLFFSARVLNELAGARDVQAIILYAACAVGLSFILLASKAGLTRMLEVNSNFMAYYRMQALEADQFIRMDFTHAENSKITEMLADMDTKTRGNGLGLMNLYYQSQSLAQNLFSLVFSIILLLGMFRARDGYTQNFATSTWAMPALFGVIVLTLILMMIYRGKEKSVMEEVFTENAKANTGAWYYNKYVQVGEAAKDIRLYAQGPAVLHIFSKSFDSKNWHRFFSFEGQLKGFDAAMLTLTGGCVYLLIGLRALAGMYAVGDVTQYVGAVTALATSAGALVSGAGYLYNNCAFLKPMLDYLNLPDLLAKGTRPLPPEKDDGYVFEFRNVSFQYPGSDVYALKDLNLRINAGQRLAVVGLNGSGKTTMIKLLCRLYEPTEGEILLDGVDIREYDYRQYHALFSVVFQDFMLFPLPIGHNVAAQEQVDISHAEDCLRGAGFGARLDTMAGGLDTVLYKNFDEDGVQVSGGEAQKIALARALYKGAPIMVLDEPTAALDPIAEFEVYSTFDKTIGDKTAVFISHRLSSCKFCHDIAVFDGGKLVQRGNHEALMGEMGGRYAELWNAQAQHYVDVKSA